MTSFWKLSVGETDVNWLSWRVSASAFIGILSVGCRRRRFFGWIFVSPRGWISNAGFGRFRFFVWIFLSGQGFVSSLLLSDLICWYFCYCYLFSSQSEQGLEAKITENFDGNKQFSDYSPISLIDLADFPPFQFFRLDSVQLLVSYSNASENEKALDTQPIAEKCQLFEDQLNSIKIALGDSIFAFSCHVDRNNSSRFADTSEVFNYLNSRLMPLCDNKLRGYWIEIWFYSDRSAGNYIIASLLQMPQINCCSDVRVQIHLADQMNLPVGEISNWLHRNYGGQRERLLQICVLAIEDFFGNV